MTKQDRTKSGHTGHSHISALQQWLENIWYNKGKGKWLLLPLSGVYCLLNGIKRRFDLRKTPFLPCPIIIVGNITVGGTGKTPLVIYLVERLLQQGYKPAIITRGYGGSASSWPQAVSPESDPQMVGDEAVLMAQRTGVPVYAGPNRVESVNTLLKEHDVDIIVSDDGLQHYKLPRDIRIAVIDYQRQLGNGLCLPAGPLRERKKRLQNCDMIILNGATKNSPQGWLAMQTHGEILYKLKTGERTNLSEFAGKTVHAVTGIGNPERFYQTLQNAGLTLIRHDFPDHYSFQADDLAFNDDLPILMTEKDAVKCKAFATDKIWFLPIEAKLSKQFDQMFLDRVTPLLEE